MYMIGLILTVWFTESICGQDVAQWAEEEKTELSHSQKPEQGCNN